MHSDVDKVMKTTDSVGQGLFHQVPQHPEQSTDSAVAAVAQGSSLTTIFAKACFSGFLKKESAPHSRDARGGIGYRRTSNIQRPAHHWTIH